MRGKRLLALLLCIVTVFQLVPCAFAEEQTNNTEEAPDFSVYAPGEIDIIIGSDGKITTSPENPAIYNGAETKAAAATEIQITAGDGWTLVPFGEPFSEDDARMIGVRLNGADIDADGRLDLSGQSWVIEADGKLPLNFSIDVPSNLPREDADGVLIIRYTFDWAEEDNTHTLTPVDGDHGTVHDRTPVQTDKNGVVQDNLPDVTPEDGFEFVKWVYTDSGEDVRPGDVLDGDVTITPVFQGKVPDVTFDVEYDNGLMLPESSNTATFVWDNAPDDFELAGITSSDPSVAKVSEVFDSAGASQMVEVKALRRGTAKFTGVSTTGETAAFDVLVSELDDSRPTASIDKAEEIKPGDTIVPDDITVEIPTVTPDGGSDTVTVTPNDVFGGEIEEGKNVVSATVDANGVNITINIIINITINQGTPVDPTDHTHTITVNPGGGGGHADSSEPLKTDRDGRVPELPTVTPDEGYVFDKWSDEAGNEVKTGDTVDDDVTITPNFEPDENYKVYTITIEPGEHGRADDDRPLKTDRGGKVPELPSVISNKNFIFDKWIDGDGSEVKTGDIIDKNIAITPVFKPDGKDRTYTLTPVDGDYGIVNDRTPIETDKNGIVMDNLPSVTPDKDYEFNKWVDQDGNQVEVGKVLNKNVIIRPIFFKIPQNKNGVISAYDDTPYNNDGLLFPVSVKIGEKYSKTLTHPISSIEDIRLNFKFDNTVLVSIESNSRSNGYGYAISAVKVNNRFVYRDTSYKYTKFSFYLNHDEVEGRVIIEVWLRKVSVSNLYTPDTRIFTLFPFNGLHGVVESNTPVKTDKNGVVQNNLPDVVPDEGYAFDKWVGNESDTQIKIIKPGVIVDSDMAIIPLFRPVTNTKVCTLIPVNGDHGTVNVKTPITTDESCIVPDNFPSVTPEDGYFFDKWVNADSGEEVKPGDVLTEDIIIKPVFSWDPSRPFTVSFETNNYYTISDTTPLTATADNKVPMEQMPEVAPIVASHFFDGVWVNVDTDEVVDANTVLTSCITVKPQINCLFTERNGAVTGFSDYAQDKNVESITIPNNIMGKTVTRIGTTAFSAHINHRTDSDGRTFSDPNPKAFEVRHVTIQEGITELGKQSFGSYNIFETMNLESISLPNGLKVIGEGAFYECGKLTSITIPDTVTMIGDAAFWGSAALETVNLGRSVKSLGFRAFMHCTALRSIRLPSSLRTIGGRCFEGAGLESVTVSDGCEVGEQAFIFCENLRTATLGEGTTSLYCTFQRCTNLRTVRLPKSITSINPNAFYYCPNLVYIYINRSKNSVSGAPWSSSQTYPTVIWTS